jgi:hypothetical protein
MQILRHIVQGTDDWFQEHLGRVSASRASAILDFTQKGFEGSKRRTYRLEKVGEILSGFAVQDNYVSAPMLAGTAAEPLARTAYELEEKVMVETVGIVIGDDERTAWSPDGLVGEHGAIEAKGPLTTTHLQTLDLIAQGIGGIPEDNQPQLWFAFMVDPDLEWIDFISRDGGMTKNKQKIDEASTAGNDLRQLPLRYAQITIRLNRSECEPQIAKMREVTARFLMDLDATVARIKSICPEMPAQHEEAPAHGEADGYLPAEYFEGLT